MHLCQKLKLLKVPETNSLMPEDIALASSKSGFD